MVRLKFKQEWCCMTEYMHGCDHDCGSPSIKHFWEQFWNKELDVKLPKKIVSKRPNHQTLLNTQAIHRLEKIMLRWRDRTFPILFKTSLITPVMVHSRFSIQSTTPFQLQDTCSCKQIRNVNFGKLFTLYTNIILLECVVVECKLKFSFQDIEQG